MSVIELHDVYDQLLDRLVDASGVSRDILASVLVRMMVRAPDDVPRADIAKGTMLLRPTTLNAGAVSKTVAALVDAGLLTDGALQADQRRAGRPIKPLRLGSDRWGLAGIKVVYEDGSATGLTGVVTTLRGDILIKLESELSEEAALETVAEGMRVLAGRLRDALVEEDAGLEGGPRELLGVGIAHGGHIHDGHVIGATHLGIGSGVAFDLATPVREELGVPVVVDNTVNVLATREIYRPVYPDPNIAFVAVFDDGVGASLILNGHVYRGAEGMAAEPGHQVVQGASEPTPDLRERDGKPGFDDPCHCGQSGHVDCYAVPTRLRAEVCGGSFAAAAEMGARDEQGELTRAGWAFKRGGEALGQGVASIINVVNPSRVVLLLPPALGQVDIGSGTAAGAYRRAVEDAVTRHSFSTGAQVARADGRSLTVHVLDPPDIPELGAKCAAIRAFDTFIEHARGRDGCRPPRRHRAHPAA
ncbi:MAG: ROK family protein [Streptosporangiaceae bacterium]